MEMEPYRRVPVMIAQQRALPPALGALAVGAAAVGALIAGTVTIGQALRRERKPAPAPQATSQVEAAPAFQVRRVSVTVIEEEFRLTDER